MRRLTHEVGRSLLDGEKYVGSPSTAKRKSADLASAGVADGAADAPWLGTSVGEKGVAHALAKIATAVSSPIARRFRRLIESSSCIRSAATPGIPRSAQRSAPPSWRAARSTSCLLYTSPSPRD